MMINKKNKKEKKKNSLSILKKKKKKIINMLMNMKVILNVKFFMKMNRKN